MKLAKIPWNRSPKNTVAHVFDNRGYGFWELSVKGYGKTYHKRLIPSPALLPSGTAPYRKEIPEKYAKD